MADPMQTRFFRKFPGAGQMCQLFSHLPDVYLIVKDAAGRFMHLNTALLIRLKLGPEESLIGKTDHDFHPKALADLYRREDLRVMESGERIIGEIHEAIDRDGTSAWFHTVKTPLLDQKNRIGGIVGMMRDYQTTGPAIVPYIEMQKVLDYIRDHYEQPITVKDLADRVGLSPSQFQRRFRSLFNTSPMAQITRIRIEAARQCLTTSTRTISEIAHQTGFYDHSHFSKKFKAEIGMSPTSYRRKYALEQGAGNTG